MSCWSHHRTRQYCIPLPFPRAVLQIASRNTAERFQCAESVLFVASYPGKQHVTACHQPRCQDMQLHADVHTRTPGTIRLTVRRISQWLMAYTGTDPLQKQFIAQKAYPGKWKLFHLPLMAPTGSETPSKRWIAPRQ